MSHYKFILDRNVLKDFVTWLPDLVPGECYYVVALARNKYVRDLPNVHQICHIRSDKQQIARFVCSKHSLVNRIWQLECPIGCLKTKDGVDLPQESLALYISVNPRSYVSGAKNALKRMADLITDNDIGYRTDQEVISCIQQSAGRKIFMDIDFDGVDLQDTLKTVAQHININCVTVLRTRGGFHLLIRLSDVEEQYKRSWYNNIVKLPGADIRGDNLIPIPGCTQGMFTPYLIR